MPTRNPVELVAYDRTWPESFERFRDELTGLLPNAQSIDHIGSTAIPGMAAKPVIDIDITLPDRSHIAGARDRMVAAGYEPRGNRYDDDVWAFMLRQADLSQRVYLCPPGNRTHQRRILFRDYLRAHPLEADEYAQLKRHLAERFREDGDRYTAEKRGFIDTIIDRAMLI